MTGADHTLAGSDFVHLLVPKTAFEATMDHVWLTTEGHGFARCFGLGVATFLGFLFLFSIGAFCRSIGESLTLEVANRVKQR